MSAGNEYVSPYAFSTSTRRGEVVITEESRTADQPCAEEQLEPATSFAQPFGTELRFTETYRLYRDAPAALRETRCLQVQYPDVLVPIEDGDLLAGRLQPRFVGFTPDEWGSCAFGYYHLPESIRETAERLDLDPQLRARVDEMVVFWDRESTAAKLHAAYLPEMAHYLPSDDWMGSPALPPDGRQRRLRQAAAPRPARHDPGSRAAPCEGGCGRETDSSVRGRPHRTGGADGVMLALRG